MIARALRAAGEIPAAGDVVALAQKIVSKAENRSVRLATVKEDHLVALSDQLPDHVGAGKGGSADD